MSLHSVHVTQPHIHKTVPRWSGQLSADTSTGIFLHKGRDGWNRNISSYPSTFRLSYWKQTLLPTGRIQHWDILLWKVLCSLHHLFGQPTQHSPQQGKGPCALTPRQSWIACNSLLFNSSGFLWHGFKASFTRFRRLKVQVPINIFFINILRGKKGPAAQNHNHKRFPE